MINERQLVEQIRKLRKPATRDAGLASLLDMLADIMARRGWRSQAERVRRIGQDIHDVAGFEEQDISGLGHGSRPKPRVGSVANQFLQREAGEGDLSKTVPAALKWIDRLQRHAQKAKRELARGEPGREMNRFVGFLKGYRDTEWYDHFFG